MTTVAGPTSGSGTNPSSVPVVPVPSVVSVATVADQPMYTNGLLMVSISIICIFIGLIFNIVSQQKVASIANANNISEKENVRSAKTLVFVTVFFNIAVLLFSCIVLFLVFTNRFNRNIQRSTLNVSILMITGFLMIVMFILQIITNQVISGIITESTEFKTAAGLSATSLAFIGIASITCMAYIIPMMLIKC